MENEQFITTSMIKSFKSCRRLYELQYIEQLKPRIDPTALSVGSSYHNLIEKILLDKYESDQSTIYGIMAEQFKNRIFPLLPKMQSVEKEFKIQIADNKFIIGKIDAVTVDGIPVEHKTTSEAIDEKYIHRLNWDDQVTNYLLAESIAQQKIINKVIYTVVRKPTIKLKIKETMEEYLLRCIDWYEEDTEQKIATFPVIRSKGDLAAQEEELIYISEDINNCKKYYRNPSHCSILGCSYSSICLSYTPETGTVDFVKKEKRNEELKGV